MAAIPEISRQSGGGAMAGKAEYLAERFYRRPNMKISFPIKFRRPEDTFSGKQWPHTKNFCEFIFKLTTWGVLIATIKFFSDRSEDEYLRFVVTMLRISLFLFIFDSIVRFLEIDLVFLENWPRLQKITNVILNSAIAALLYLGIFKFMTHIITVISEMYGLK
jgi:hypothetical protein